MYGDTRVIRALADDLREQAHDIDREAEALVGHADGCPWNGRAADAMRRRSRDRATGLRRTAARHRDAAQALDRHAAEIDRVKELIESLEKKALALVGAARDRLGDLLAGAREVVGDGADLLLDRFVPPPSGHRAWLDVEMPGLHR